MAEADQYQAMMTDLIGRILAAEELITQVIAEQAQQHSEGLCGRLVKDPEGSADRLCGVSHEGELLNGHASKAKRSALLNDLRLAQSLLR